MKKLKIFFAMVLSLLFVVTAADIPTSVSLASENTTKVVRKNPVKVDNGKVLKFAENDRYKLTLQKIYYKVDFNGSREVTTFEEATAQSFIIKVTDKVTGAEWTTNPTDPVKDGLAIQNIDTMRSQITLSYYDTNGNLKTMDSYSDCMANEFDEDDPMVQYDFYAIKNGLAVVFDLGSYKKTVDMIPQKMTTGRFESVFLSGKLSAEEEEKILKYYKYYEKEDMYSVKPMGRNNFKTVLEYMDKVGYTSDDLIADNNTFGISNTTINRAYFKVTMEFVLTDEGLKVNVPMDELVCDPQFPIYEITPVPYFGCIREPLSTDDFSYMPTHDANGNEYAKSEIYEMVLDEYSKGYMFVPDGSGAIIQFNAKAMANYYYSQAVYGIEKTLSKNTQTTVTTQSLNATMPVYGLSDGKNGYLAIIEGSEATATINAYRARYRINQNYINATFRVYNIDYVYLSTSGELSTVPIFQKTLHDEDYTISYHFMSDSPSYSDMAKKYRSYLESKGLIEKMTKEEVETEAPFYLTTVGGVYGYKSFMGISYRGLISATSYEQNIEILKALKDIGVNNVDLRLVGWFNNGVKHDFPADIDLDSVLGGSSGMDELIKYSKENKIDLYPDVDFMTTYTGGNGFSSYSDGAKSIEGTYVKVSDISYATTKPKTDSNLKPIAKSILSPKRYLEVTEDFLSDFEDYEFGGISLRASGNELYSDYNEDAEYNRVKTKDEVISHLDMISGKVGKVMTSNANQYAVKYTDTIINAPTDYSWYYVTDYAVPFYQMVYHGYVNLGSSALNLTADYKYETLRAIEYGTSINFELIYEDGSVLTNTEYTDNYSANYKVWLEAIKESYAMVNKTIGKLQGETIDNHEKVAENVYKTTYSNGASVYVNYNFEDVEVGNVKIAARNVAVEEA